ncbi:unnamed protein product, partial [Polarella glacialis]
LVERLLPVAPTAGGCMRESLAERIGLKESEKNWLQFEALEVQWPHGSFFQPEVLSWMPSSNEVNASFDTAGELFLGSSFSHHRLSLPLVRGPPPLRLEEIGDAAEKNRDGSGPPSSGAVPLCGPLSSAGGCFLASPGLEEGQGWIDIWAFHQEGARCHEHGPMDDLGVRLRIAPRKGGRLAKPWLILTGAVVRCSLMDASFNVTASTALESGSWCLLLAGWDGERLPVAL